MSKYGTNFSDKPIIFTRPCIFIRFLFLRNSETQILQHKIVYLHEINSL